MKKLYLFTANYPYGYIESFLEVEILYLSNVFDEIIIIPFSGNNLPKRDVPNNCIVRLPIKKHKIQYIFGLFGIKTLPLFIKDFFIRKVYLHYRSLKKWCMTYLQTNIYFQSKTIRKILKELTNENIVYFYWGIVGSTILPFHNKKAKIISRFHGDWDLWEESSGNYAPIRKYVAKKLDLGVFISFKGEEYFKERYPYCKTIVSRLGTIDNGISNSSKDNVLRIVSCSLVTPVKRVHIIFKALQTINNIEILWTHIGGEGHYFEELKELAKNRPKNIKINFLGQISNKDVLEYYKNNEVDMFINVSKIEGIPVSIMEAISFNIPIIATDVGGTSEIVTKDTGILISENPSEQEIVDAIYLLQKKNFSPREYWLNNYNAENNYKEFSRKLISL